MTGTESTHPNGLVKFTSPEAEGQHGLTVQTFVEVRCMSCRELYDVDLQHITNKQEAIGHVGDAWGWCKTCIKSERDRGHYDPDMNMRSISQEEARRLYPHHGDRIEIDLRKSMKGGPFECSHGKKNCDDNHYHGGVKITDPCDEPGCLQPRGSHFHYKPTLYSNQIQIGTEEAERVAFESDLQKRTREESGHVPAEIREAVMKDSSILRMKDEASAYFDAEARKDDLAREKAKVSQLRNLDIGVTKKWADVSL